MAKQNAWNVWLPNGKGGRARLVDTVWFDADMDAEAVRRSLIDHDGYDPRITVNVSMKRKGAHL